MEKKSNCMVCVTGGAGYIGSSLVKKLLDRGYTVHATLRNLEDESKVGLLKSFPGADKRLKLFQADIYKPEEFEKAIQGCEFVFHVATPLLHSDGFHYKNRTEATIAAVKKIGMSCLKSGTVKKLIYTASVVAASPLKDDGTNFKDLMDETCWTPLNFSNPYADQGLRDYVESKMLAEKEMLNFGKEDMEVVTLCCGLVGGDTYLPYTPTSTALFLSLLSPQEKSLYNTLKFLEELIGKVPIVHIEDVCEAHLFSIKAAVNGRFLLASSFVSSAEIGCYYQRNYPEFNLNQEYLNDPKREIKWGSKKLVDNGFVYKYGMKEILDDSVSCARKNGTFQQQ
ncbi:NADPH HC-toxin reductase 1 [Nicotiana tabacum]|uniref:Anthocyanidin reductase n=1 Tax=Nicotiana tabacum TaxID=4097 RepID=A0A1S4A1J9_TOBAC|nr:PREDICTED: anthocyanidin reductase-like [Nicotiana tabacum]